MNKDCKGCKKTFWSKKSKTDFCSSDCYLSWLRGPNGPIVARAKNCMGCNKLFIGRHSSRKFCSHICYLKFNRGEVHGMYGKSHTLKTRKILSEIHKKLKHNISGLISPENISRTKERAFNRRGAKNPKLSEYLKNNPPKVCDWHIRSPSGICYKIHNLKKWIRERSDWFENWQRAYKGIQKLNCVSRWQLPTQYKGWTLVSNSEIRQNNKKDILNRKILNVDHFEN